MNSASENTKDAIYEATIRIIDNDRGNLRRERDEARAALARVTAERNNARDEIARWSAINRKMGIELEAALEETARLATTNREYAALVAKLPVTADSATITPGMRVRYEESDRARECIVCRVGVGINNNVVLRWAAADAESTGFVADARQCFSALAAKEGKGNG